MNHYPLTSAQREIWFDQQLHPGVPLYTIGGYLEFRGRVDTSLLVQAINLAICKHDSMRTVLVDLADEDGLPTQTFLDHLSIDLTVRDFCSDPDPEQAALVWMQKRFETPFELIGQPLFGFDLVRVADDRIFWLQRFHHLIADGWGCGLFTTSVAEIYNQLSRGETPALEACSYATFIEDDRRYISSESFERDRDYWLSKFRMFPETLLFPRHGNGMQQTRAKSGRELFSIKRLFYQQLGELAKKHQATVFHVLLGALYVYFTRVGQRDNMVIGLPVLNRSNARFRKTTGLFVGVNPLLLAFGNELNFSGLLKQINRTLRNDYRHQRFPMSEIRRVLDPAQNGQRAFDIGMSFEKMDLGFTLGECSCFPHSLVHGHERTPLMLFIREYQQHEDVIFDFVYNQAYFTAEEIRQLQLRLVTILEAALEQDEVPIACLPVMTSAERTELQLWNETATAPPEKLTTVDLFAGQVRRAPEMEAVAGSGERLSYGELNRRANRLAHRLMALGVGPESRVGICLERSPAMVVAALAVMKAGGAYVPMADDLPAARRRFILEDCGAVALLTRAALVPDEVLPCPVIDLDEPTTDWPEQDPPPRCQPDNLAYLIYTSGSTGQPKGVMIEQRALVNFITSICRLYDVGPGDRMTQLASIAFDVSVSEIFSILCAGATLVIPSREEVLDPERFVSLLARERITLFGATPLLLSQLHIDRQSHPHLRQIFSGGDALGLANLHGLPEDIPVANGYGPTETTIGATAYRLTRGPEEAERIPIGKPLPNYRIYILDETQRPLPIGVPGELCIAGVGLARGYLNRPELTAEKFLEVELFGQRERIYRTGDKARWLADGNLEFLGRFDHQVKLRGFRIELGEIEATLGAHPAVSSAAVLLKERAGNAFLAAYVALREGEQTPKLQAWLASRLPEYMVPKSFTVLDGLPLTANGKIDRSSLPEPEVEMAAGRPLSGPTETRLARLWAELLGLAEATLTGDSHFFNLGGHSLLATRLASRIRVQFGIEIPLPVLFEKAHLGDMAAWLDQRQQSESLPSIVPLSEASPEVLSYAQQRLWFLSQLEGESASYNMPAAVRLQGALDLPALRQTFIALQERHQSLRQCFPDRNGEPVVRLRPVEDLLAITDLTSLPAPERKEALRKRSEEHATAPFDLQNGPLLRLELLLLGDDEQVLLFNMHHIISDGWSLEVLLRDWAEIYAAACQGRLPALPPLSIQYADYAAWQRRWLQGERLQGELDYWTRALAGAPQLLELPTDHRRPAVQSHHGANMRTRLAPDLSRQLKALSQGQGTTLFMTLLAGFSVLLARNSHQHDLLIGTPIANRTQSQTENLIGFFVNTLVLRTRIDTRQSFADLLAQVRQNALEAYAHQDVPFEALVEALNPVRSLSHSPLFQVMFALQNTGDAPLALPGLEVEVLPTAQGIAKFDLALGMGEDGDALVCDWEYCVALFEPDTIARLAASFELLLHQCVANPAAPLSEFFLPNLAERTELQLWNETAAGTPEEVTTVDLFAGQVKRAPEMEAVAGSGERLSYGELNRRANRLAHRLMALGVGPESRVGLCLERSPAMVVAALAVMKAGGAYVPMADDLPAARRRFILEDCGAAALLTRAALLPDEALPCPVIDLDEPTTDWPEQDPPPRCQPDHLAYLIYTSGSTGQPKGVMIEQRALVNFITAFNRLYAIGPGDRVPQLASIAFDVSVSEIFPMLCAGGTLVIPSREEVLDPERFVSLLARERITLFGATPLLLSQLHIDRQSHPHLRQIFSGGDALGLANLHGLPEDIPVANGYGPTETTIGATAYRLTRGPEEAERIPIGKPLPNYRIYILDETQRPLPIGVPGELCIAGVGLARGYLNRPELTAEKFLEVELFGQRERIYRTGDKARWLADGNLEFLGRFDHQVKLRGFRIELGEIEKALGTLPGVVEAAVLVRGEGAEKQLIGYVSGAGLDGATLRSALKTGLPDYMIPAAMVVMERLPLNNNGKIDRAALPEPESFSASGEGAHSRNAIEEIVIGVWAEVLGQTPSHLHDNFFELGGHSLLATRCAARLRDSLGLTVPVRWVFEFPTVAELAERLRRALTGTDDESAAPVPANAIRPGSLRITPEDLSLVDLTQDEIDRIVLTVEGGAANIQDIYPLSPLQEGMLFHHLLQPEKDPYLSQVQLAFESHALCQAFIDALQIATDRHDILRTAFIWEQLAEPVQVVWRQARMPVEVRQFDPDQGPVADQLHRYCAQHASIDLTRAPLRRVILAEDGDRVIMSLVGHHLTIDHSTLDVLLAEVKTIMEGRGDTLTPTVPYRNFVAQMRSGTSRAAHEAFFREKLGTVETPTAPFGLLDVRGDGSGVACASRDLPTDLALRIRRETRRQGATPASLFHLAFALLLSRCAGQNDVVFGTVLVGRLQGGEGIERSLGLFINTLPLHIACDARPACVALRDTQQEMLALMRHEHASLGLAQRCSAIPGALPLFSALLNYRQGDSRGSTEVPIAGVKLLASEGATNYPFVCSIDDLGEDFFLSIGVDASIDPERVFALMQRTLVALVEALEASPQTPLSALDLLPPTEREVFCAWNATAETMPDDCMPGLIEQWAARTPDAIAVIGAEARLSYGELNRRANRLAHRLMALGVGPESRVGLCLERSPAMVVAALAVMKAGGAYVPMATDLPAARRRFILEDSGAVLLLTRAAMFPDEALPCPVIDLDEPTTDWPEQDPPPRCQPDNLAYLIYTSGSTGQPKGVMIEQRGLVNFITAVNRLYAIGPGDRLPQLASIAFDISVCEIFSTLGAGATLVIPSREEVLDPERFVSLLSRERITLFGATPLLLSQLHIDRQSHPHLRQIFSGGDALGLANLHGLPEDIPVANGYGPTETTIGATAYRLTRGPEEAERIPIGKPLPNYRIYILDEAQRPLPIGVPGELCIAGVGLARGYLNRPELTAEKFLEVELFGQRERIYRTGDKARWLADGNLEFLGRFDHQVKLRGFRIELGEIEKALGNLPGVVEAAVLVRGEGAEKQLIGYVSGAGLDGATLRSALKTSLPDYMIPAAMVVMERLPLNNNGKIDRAALPEPDMLPGSNDLVAPRNARELLLTRIWEEVLGLSPIGIHADFFALGGHSLLAVRLMGRIQQHFGRSLPLASLFRCPTIAEFGQLLESENMAQEWLDLVPIQPRGSRPPLYLLPGAGGHVLYYRALAMHLGNDQPVHGLETPGLHDGVGIQDSIEQHAARLRHTLRQNRDAGPLQLAGHSAGAIVAFELARQLEAEGVPVQQLIILDAAAPDPNPPPALSPREALRDIIRILETLADTRLELSDEALDSLPDDDSRYAFVLERVRESNRFALPGNLHHLVAAYVAMSRNQSMYRPGGPVHCPVTLVKASEPLVPGLAADPRPDWGWQEFTMGPVKVIVAPGTHLSMLTEPHVASLATLLTLNAQDPNRRE